MSWRQQINALDLTKFHTTAVLSQSSLLERSGRFGCNWKAGKGAGLRRRYRNFHSTFNQHSLYAVNQSVLHYINVAMLGSRVCSWFTQVNWAASYTSYTRTKRIGWPRDAEFLHGLPHCPLWMAVISVDTQKRYEKVISEHSHYSGEYSLQWF